jgi:hypothetical protein
MRSEEYLPCGSSYIFYEEKLGVRNEAWSEINQTKKCSLLKLILINGETMISDQTSFHTHLFLPSETLSLSLSLSLSHIIQQSMHHQITKYRKQRRDKGVAGGKRERERDRDKEVYVEKVARGRQ